MIGCHHRMHIRVRNRRRIQIAPKGNGIITHLRVFAVPYSLFCIYVLLREFQAALPVAYIQRPLYAVGWFGMETFRG